MSLINVSVPNLINGVSQQADSLRFPSQCDEQINALSSVVDGLTKRPPLNHAARLYEPETLNASAFFHSINRDTTERYEVVVEAGSPAPIKVFSLSGTSYTVYDEGMTPLTTSAYLASTTPDKSLRALTVADYTLFLNRDITVSLLPDVVPATNPAALLFLKTFRQGMDITVTVQGHSAVTFSISAETLTAGVNKGEYTFSNSANATLGYGLDQGSFMDYIRTILAAIATGYTLTHADGVMHVTRATDFTIAVTCSVGEALFLFKESVQNFSMLPKKGWVGFQIRVMGDPEESGDDYYITYSPSKTGDTGFAPGFWEESQKPGITYKLDPTTLPHVLISYGSYFVFKPAPWADRESGDEDTNPDPSFVGQTIRNLFFWKNRLGLLSGENIIMSEASEFFNFWRTSVITLLDADPIDVGVSHSRISILNAAIPNSEKLVLISDQTQFTLQGGDLLTPKTVSVTQTTDYESLKDVDPLSLGNSIFMGFARGQYSGLLEYFIQSDNALYTGSDVSSHVPRYIEGSLTKLVGSETEGLIIAMTSTFTTGVYVYRYYTRDNQKLMSAWSKFEFGATVRDVFIIDTKVYVVLDRPDGTILEYMDVASGLRDTNSDYAMLLDRRIDETLLSRGLDTTANTTVILCPYPPTANTQVVTKAGMRLRVVDYYSQTLVVRGVHNADELWVGEPYTMSYTMTKPTLRMSDGRGNYVVNPGRFQVRRGLLSFNDSLYFRVNVTPLYRDTYSYVYENRNVDVGNVVVNQPTSLRDGSFSFPVFSKNDQVTIEVVNDSPYPSNLLGVDWEALYTVRSTRQ